ncbi:hypothetical protein ABW20_dc0108845 [Dactylellina cionopaga]|nr:hypothetical protein ABW20_dc0108845 [Dactylellina cionopaga]
MRGDLLLLRLTQLEDVVPTLRAEREEPPIDVRGVREPIPRVVEPQLQPGVLVEPTAGFPAFRKTVQYPPNNEYERLVKVFRCAADFSGTPVAGEATSDSITIEEQTSAIQVDGSTSNPTISKFPYHKMKTVFTPAFYSLTRNAGISSTIAAAEDDESVYTRQLGVDSSEVKLRQFVFWEKTDIADFQHSLSGYRIRKLLRAESTTIYRRAMFGRTSSKEIRNAIVQIWVKEPLQKVESSSTGFLHPPGFAPRNSAANGQGRASGLLPHFPLSPEQHPMSPKSSSRESTASYMSNVSRTVTYLEDPECSKLLIYGSSTDGKKILTVISVNELVGIKRNGCCTPGKLIDRSEISACCPNALVYANQKTAEVTEFTEDSHNVFNGGYASSVSQSGRIALPIEVNSWASAGKPVKFNGVLIRCKTKQDKLGLVDGFNFYRGKYQADQTDFQQDNMERRIQQGFKVVS